MGEQPLAGSHGDRMDPYLVAVNQVGCRQGMYELAAARDDDRPTWLALQLLTARSRSSRAMIVVPGHEASSRVLEATYFGRLLRAAAMESSGSVMVAQCGCQISYVRRPNKKSPAWGSSSATACSMRPRSKKEYGG